MDSDFLMLYRIKRKLGIFRGMGWGSIGNKPQAKRIKIWSLRGKQGVDPERVNKGLGKLDTSVTHYCGYLRPENIPEGIGASTEVLIFCFNTTVSLNHNKKQQIIRKENSLNVFLFTPFCNFLLEPWKTTKLLKTTGAPLQVLNEAQCWIFIILEKTRDKNKREWIHQTLHRGSQRESTKLNQKKINSSEEQSQQWAMWKSDWSGKTHRDNRRSHDNTRDRDGRNRRHTPGYTHTQ